VAAGEEVRRHTSSTVARARSSSTAAGRCAEAGGSRAGGGDAQGQGAHGGVGHSGMRGDRGLVVELWLLCQISCWRRQRLASEAVLADPVPADPRPADPMLRQEVGRYRAVARGREGWREEGRTPVRWEEGRREGGKAAAGFFGDREQFLERRE
jgi:hypothetical protein